MDICLYIYNFLDRLCGNVENILNEDASGTVDFIKTMDDVFDSLNGSCKINTKGKFLKTSVSTREDNEHEVFWNKILPVFENMYVWENGQKKIMPCFKNWQITLNGFKILRKTLKDCGFTRMKTRRFKEDVENFFGKIRQ